MPGHKPKKRAPKLLVWEKEIKRNLLLKQNFISISLSSAPLFLVNPALADGDSLMTSSTRVLTFLNWLLILPLFLLLFLFLLLLFLIHPQVKTKTTLNFKKNYNMLDNMCPPKSKQLLFWSHNMRNPFGYLGYRNT